MSKIINVLITELPNGRHVVYVSSSKGRMERLFSYDPEEVRFTASELSGLTKTQAFSLLYQKEERAYQMALRA